MEYVGMSVHNSIVLNNMDQSRFKTHAQQSRYKVYRHRFIGVSVFVRWHCYESWHEQEHFFLLQNGHNAIQHSISANS